MVQIECYYGHRALIITVYRLEWRLRTCVAEKNNRHAYYVYVFMHGPISKLREVVILLAHSRPAEEVYVYINRLAESIINRRPGSVRTAVSKHKPSAAEVITDR